MHDQLAPGGLVVYGELHGTREMPAVVAAAATEAAERGAITIAIEWPDHLQPGVDALIAADAPAGATLWALSSPFWAWRDGRSSEAMFALLEQARVLRAGGTDVAIVCMDGVFDGDDDRDAGMAEVVLAAIVRRPYAATLVLCGNSHARSSTSPATGWHLRARRPTLVAIDLCFDGGTTFANMNDGPGVHELPARGDARRGLVMHEQRDEHGFDGAYYLGPVTASPPFTRGA